MSLPVVILGAGGHAKVVMDTLRAMGRTVLGFVAPEDAYRPAQLLGAPCLGDDQAVAALGGGAVELALGFGMVVPGPHRRRIFDDFHQQGFRFATLCHPSAVVAADVVVDEGAQVMAGAVIQPGSSIGANAIINTSVVIDHDCQVEAHAHLATGAVLSGGVRVGTGAMVGMGARVIQGITVGAAALVAAGAVVIAHVPDGEAVAGVPAKSMKIRRTA